ncbi:MAG: cysteine desulfurase [Pedobacter sp.]|nr:MAG: cysteine desulfurase [Pedobacter sp.]
MNNIIYLDNAATTAVDPQVFAKMEPYLNFHYGNPSSSYGIGRQSRMAVEGARKSVANLLGVKPTSIYFTSGGTESNNTAIASAIYDLNCTHIITSPTEHHAVLHAVEHYCKRAGISSSFVKINSYGEVDLVDLEQQLAQYEDSGSKCLVSLMHANNEIGSLLDISHVGELCQKYGAIFHSDCVQTIGHYPLDLEHCGVHFASASGHKFHGPKGTGILYVHPDIKFSSLILGGGQERGKRAGTENVHGIIGFSAALEMAMESHSADESYIRQLNVSMRQGLVSLFPGTNFNSTENGLYTVLSVNFPKGTNTDILLAMLDRDGIYASGGSACSSGESGGSHVITALNKEIAGATIRFSFSKLTKVEDIEAALACLSKILVNQTKSVFV